MATVSAAAPASTFAGTTILPGRPALASPSVLGLPRLACKGGTVRCSKQAKPQGAAAATVAAGAAVSAALAMAAASLTTTGPALALVDDRMSTEGTGLSLGISNNLLAWILLGVFGLIWALYFAYTSTLDEDEDSALSL